MMQRWRAEDEETGEGARPTFTTAHVRWSGDGHECVEAGGGYTPHGRASDACDVALSWRGLWTKRVAARGVSRRRGRRSRVGRG